MKNSKTKTEHVRLTREDWRAEGVRRFGADTLTWRWKCPSCGYVCSTLDYKEAGAPVGAVAYSCIGRWLDVKVSDAFSGGPGPCNYAGGGLLCINPVTVESPDGTTQHVFEFAARKRKTRANKAGGADEQASEK